MIDRIVRGDGGREESENAGGGNRFVIAVSSEAGKDIMEVRRGWDELLSKWTGCDLVY